MKFFFDVDLEGWVGLTMVECSLLIFHSKGYRNQQEIYFKVLIGLIRFHKLPAATRKIQKNLERTKSILFHCQIFSDLLLFGFFLFLKSFRVNNPTRFWIWILSVWTVCFPGPLLSAYSWNSFHYNQSICFLLLLNYICKYGMFCDKV